MSRLVNRLHVTLALIKPEATANPVVLKCIQQIMKDEFVLVRDKTLQLSRSDAEMFYAEHKGRFFYNRLVSYMTSGPIWAHILAGQDAISRWRTLMGPTKVFKAIHEEPASIRGRFGLTDTRNCTHGSDSEESARREIALFYPDFNIDEWLKQQEQQHRPNR